MSKAHVQFLARSETEITYSVVKNGRGVGEVSARSALAKHFPAVSPLDCPTLLQIGNSGCKYARMGVVRP